MLVPFLWEDQKCLFSTEGNGPRQCNTRHQTKEGEKQERGEGGGWKTEGKQKDESSSLGNKGKLHYNIGCPV